MKSFTLTLCLAAVAAIGCKKQTPAYDYDSVFPGHHLSEHQALNIAAKELAVGGLPLRCEFTNGIWEILEIQKTNIDGKAMITPSSATRVVLRVRDVDGTVEQVKTP